MQDVIETDVAIVGGGLGACRIACPVDCVRFTFPITMTKA